MSRSKSVVKSLNGKVFSAFALLVIIPALLLMIFQSVYLSGSFTQYLTNNTIQNVNNHNKLAETSMNSAAQALSQMASNEDIQKVIRDAKDKNLTGATYIALQRAYLFISQTEQFMESGFVSVVLATEDFVITHYKAYQPELGPEWYKRTSKAQGKVVWNSLNSVTRNKVETISASRIIFDPDTKAEIGAIYVSFARDKIFGADMFSNQTVFFKHEELGLFSPEPDNANFAQSIQSLDSEEGYIHLATGGKNHIAAFSEKNSYGWQTVCVIPYWEFVGGAQATVIGAISALFVFLIFFFIFLARIFSKLITPLQKLMNYINENTDHTVALIQDSKGYPELSEMIRKWDSMMERNETTLQELNELSVQNDINSLKRMQTQINPHFLYNTLNSIKILVDTGRTREISRVITDLVHLLSSSLDKSGRLITVEDEINTLNRYIAIERMIYGNHVRFMLTFDPALNHYIVPNFILQPIVENALVHGLNHIQDKNLIEVYNHSKNDTLMFEIIDNGFGMSGERLREIQNSLDTNTESSHVGILSVHRRIQLSCGEQYGVHVISKLNEGTHFTITLPLMND